MRFSAFTLMRPGEVFALEWRDVDLDANRIHVQRRLYRGRVDTPKSGESKKIVLTPPARDALLGLRRDGQFVFTGMRGERLSSTTVRRYWREVSIKAGLDFDLYHATKHYGVHYLWTKLNLSNRAIAAQAGWKVATVDKLLAVYGHGDVGALEEVDRAAWSDNVVPIKAAAEARA